MTPFHVAAERGRCEEILGHLLLQGGNINIKNGDGVSNTIIRVRYEGRLCRCERDIILVDLLYYMAQTMGAIYVIALSFAKHSYRAVATGQISLLSTNHFLPQLWFAWHHQLFLLLSRCLCIVLGSDMVKLARQLRTV